MSEQEIFEPDFSNVKICEFCKSLNISRDISTGKIQCNDCKSNWQKGFKLDLENEHQKMIQAEENNIQSLKQIGIEFELPNNQKTIDPSSFKGN